MPISIGIVTPDILNIQISTQKDSLLGDTVLICSLVKKVCSPYQGNDFSNGKPNDRIEDVETGENIHTYYYNTAKNKDFETGMYLAFIYSDKNTKMPDISFTDHQDIIISNEKLKYAVHYCTSSEGVHVISKSSDLHLYYSLGYEVEANCSDEVYE